MACSPKTHRIKKGLDIPIEGPPEQAIHPGRKVSRVALVADDYVGMKARMRVAEGDSVKAGQPLFEDRKSPGIIYTAPASGKVLEISRGDRRALRSLSIEIEGDGLEQIEYASYKGSSISELTGEDVRALLIESGLWTALRGRPFGRVPGVDTTPRSVFVTATDTHPLAPDPEVALIGREDDFFAGVEALAKLVGEGALNLCVNAGSSLSARGCELPGVQVHEFSGPHPAGTAGLHMHLIDPVDRDRVSWSVGYQDTAAIGHLFRTGAQSYDRVVSVAGPLVENPRLVSTRLGASLVDLLEGELEECNRRVVSGSIVEGRDATAPDLAYLGRHHNGVTVLKEGDQREFLGWMIPGVDLFTVTKLFLSSLTKGTRFEMDTSTHGGLRTIVPNGSFERVMPFDMMPFFLLRALLSADVEKAEALGCLELCEEDLALCTFVCPSKIDYGAALRAVLETIEKEG